MSYVIRSTEYAIRNTGKMKRKCKDRVIDLREEEKYYLYISRRTQCNENFTREERGNSSEKNAISKWRRW